jgi:anthranilate synthase component 1
VSVARRSHRPARPTLRTGAARADVASLARGGNVVPVCREILADLETPVSAFLKIHRGDYGFLLESVQGGEKWARYSFLGTEPARVVRTRGHTLEIETPGSAPGSGTVQKTVEDPLDALRGLVGAYRPVAVPGIPRFAGGAVGSIGYDMVRTFERLPARLPDDLGVPDSCLMLAESVLVFDNVAQKIKVISLAHVGDGKSPDDAHDAAVARIDALVARLGMPPVEPAFSGDAPGEVRSNCTQAEYEAMVDRAKEYIRAGDVIQVVLAQRFELPLAAAPFDVYRCLRTVNPSPYMFHLALGDHFLVGASPEVMTRVEDGQVTVRPIAGTRPRGTSEQDDALLAAELAADPKELAEHVMLLDLGRNDVGRVAQIGSVQVTERFAIERYSHVMHLVSNVTGKLAPGRDCVPGGDAHGGTEDPRDGDHRGARVRPPRGVRRRRRLLRLRRRDGHRDHDPHGAREGRPGVRPVRRRHRGRLRPRVRAPRVREQGARDDPRGPARRSPLMETPMAAPRLLMIDNYDSFTWNLVQYLGELGADVDVRRNDAVTLDEIAALRPDGIVISPGPCTPREAGVSVPVIERFAGAIPILGVCLGHQAIGAAFGGAIVRAPRIMHGKTSPIHHDARGVFAGLPNPFDATRYHSLVIDPATLPAVLERTAWTDEGEIMAVRHRTLPVEGVQFHPESILTVEGKRLLGNFLAGLRGESRPGA